MNKDTEIKAVKDQMRELAEKLESLEAPETRKPKVGDVIQQPIGGAIQFVTSNGLCTLGNSNWIGMESHEKSVNLKRVHDGDCDYLGTFDEVYVLRDEAGESDRLKDFKMQITGWYDYDGKTIFDGGVDVSEFFAFVKSITLSR